MAAVTTRHHAGAAFALALATILALALPFAQPAVADHPTGSTLEVLEEVATNASGTVHTLTAQLFLGTTNSPQTVSPTGIPVNIDFEVESGPAIRSNCTIQGNTCTGGTVSDSNNSPNTPDMTCDIQPNASSCVVVFTSDNGGENLIRAFIDENRNNAGAGNTTYDGFEGRYSGSTDCGGRSTTPSGTGPGDRCDVSPVLQTQLTPVPGTTQEPDTTDVVSKTWTQTVTGNTCVDVDPNTDTNATGTIHQLDVLVTTAATRAASTTSNPSEDSCEATGAVGRRDVVVELSLADGETGIVGSDDPNAFFVAVDGEPTGATGGGPDTVTCTTDVLGECSVTIRTVLTSATGDNYVIGRVEGASGGTGGACADPNFPGATGGTATGANNSCTAEVVRKIWAAPGTVTNVDARPEEDTNEVNTPHVLTATATNALDTGVSGQAITFDVTAGVNSTRDIDGSGSTPAGFIGSCTASATGTCSVSYTSPLVGDDTITACIDADGNFSCDGTEADSANTTTGDANDDQVLKHWVAAGAGPSRLSLDMEGCNGSTTNPADTATYQDTATANDVSNDRNDAHAACATVFNSVNTPVKSSVTFTITAGPGSFIVPSSTNDSTHEEGSSNDLGATVTVAPGSCLAGAPGPGNAPTTGTGAGTGPYACAFLLSDITGSTVISACVEGSTTICDTGTKPWTTAVQNARFVDVTPETASNEPGTPHEMTAAVTDRFGNGVPNVGITWSRTGEGTITSQEATTNADGEARIVVTSQTEGTTTVTATIPAATTDCDEPAGSPAGRQSATAGDCVESGTKTWTEDPTTECNDTVDNDGDGRIDLADPGCANEDDDTESPDPPKACQNRGSGENVLVGTSGPDVLNGTSGRDVICGAGGDDVINGAGGNDLIVGNGGDDTISGGGGKDNLAGNAGADVISGNSGNDAIKGNAGNDTLRGNGGIDSLTGGGGNDKLLGGNGEDILRGGGGNDVLKGGRRADALNGGPGRDRCAGGPGRDSVRRCE